MRSLLFATLLFTACSESTSEDAAIKRCFVGDPNMPPEIQAVFLDQDNVVHELNDGDRLPLILPPQGGKVAFVGVRAKNVDGCPLIVSSSFRDTCENIIIARISNPIELNVMGDQLVPLPPIDFQQGIPGFSNLPACPAANIPRDISEYPYLLTIRIEDKDGRKAEKMLTVTPYCAQPGMLLEQCTCECQSDFTTGAACNPSADAGVNPGECPADAGM